MKKFVVLLITIFLASSVTVFSQNKTHNTVQFLKTEQPKKSKKKTSRKPRKLEPKKRVHKPGPKKHSVKKSGSGIKL